MTGQTRGLRAAVIGLIVTGGVLPLLLYGWVFARVPVVSADEAQQRLEAGSDAPVVLVDVRAPERFDAGHLPAAKNWPYEAIRAVRSADDVPAEFRGRTLLTLCDSGLLSSLAARTLRERAGLQAISVRGGMQMWIAGTRASCPLSLCTMQSGSGEATGLPFRAMPPYEQWAAVAAGFVIKPLYMLGSLVLILTLRRCRSAALSSLRWGLIAFLAGEAMCAMNYLAYGETSALLEYLHSFGMVAAFGFTTHAVAAALDGRFIRYSDPDERCAAIPLCRGCIKYQDAPCGFRRLFLLLLPAFMVLSLLPLCATFVTTSYNTRILGTPYNYTHAVVHQLYEIRFLPVVAVVLFGASFGVLRFAERYPIPWSKMFFAAASGAISFSLFRAFLLGPFQENLVWFAFWEEATEFLYVAGAAAVLLVFRQGIFARPGAVAAG